MRRYILGGGGGKVRIGQFYLSKTCWVSPKITNPSLYKQIRHLNTENTRSTLKFNNQNSGSTKQNNLPDKCHITFFSIS